MDAINSFCLWITDPVLGWMLHLPRDAALFIVAIGTALILTLVRLFTTNQDLLKRCKNDLRRVKELIRDAKKRGDKEALKRHRATVQQINLRKFSCEGKPLLVSIIPIAVLAVWCFSRIAYRAPKGDDPVVVRAYFEISEIGDLVYILPQGGLQAESGLISRVKEDKNTDTGEVANGVAEWKLLCKKRPEPYTVKFRYRGKTYAKELLVDGVHYSQPIELCEGKTLELALPEYKLFGFVPGINWIMLQPWIVGYLVIVIPFSVVLKPLLHIY